METFTFIGIFVVALIICTTLKELYKFIQKIVVGKYKVKCICKHEYVPYMKWYGGKHGIDYIFKCNKCDKRKEIKSYQNSKEETIF